MVKMFFIALYAIAKNWNGLSANSLDEIKYTVEQPLVRLTYIYLSVLLGTFVREI